MNYDKKSKVKTVVKIMNMRTDVNLKVNEVHVTRLKKDFTECDKPFCQTNDILTKKCKNSVKFRRFLTKNNVPILSEHWPSKKSIDLIETVIFTKDGISSITQEVEKSYTLKTKKFFKGLWALKKKPTNVNVLCQKYY